jgi:hypothetical protein
MGRPHLIVLIAGCLSSPYPLFSWWETGHEAAARVAAAHLTPAARTQVAGILGVPDTSKSVADGLARASVWADEIKNETNTGAWHYVNLTLQDRESDIPARCKNDNCAPARIRLFASQLAAGSGGGAWDRLDALRFVVHLVADIHQPLHTISDADLGGNCERLDPPIAKAANLHALWDGGIIQRMDVNDRGLAADLEKDIGGMGIDRQQQLARGNQNDWVWESHVLAVNDIYKKLRVPMESPEFPASCEQAPLAITEFKPRADGLYIDDMKPVVRVQLEKAALRLARLLNESLGSGVVNQ